MKITVLCKTIEEITVQFVLFFLGGGRGRGGGKGWREAGRGRNRKGGERRKQY